jgi:predicted nucleic acid-binding protein
LIVLDTSAAIEFLAGLQHGEWVESEILADPDLHAPHVIDIEVVGVFRRLARERRIADERATAAIEALIGLDIVRYPHVPLLPRVWELRPNLRAADAAFVALAEVLDARLLTTDERIARAPAHRATVVTPR